jgi:hypothetical protein
MTKNEMELIEMIRGYESPETALAVAIEVITDYLRQLGSSEVPFAAEPPELF